jgi:hypothetical protein
LNPIDRKEDFAMRDLNYQLKQLCHRNRDGSFATQVDRERLLTSCANDLAAHGFQHLHADSLKPKHVAALLDKWKQDGISTGTLKNRMSALRWWAEKVGKENVIARANAEYGIAERVFVTNVSKAKVLDANMLVRVTIPIRGCPCSCRQRLDCGGRKASRSSQDGPIAEAFSGYSRAGPKEASIGKCRLRRRSSAPCWTRPRRWRGKAA